MTRRKRLNYSATFKAQVAVAALKGDKTEHAAHVFGDASAPVAAEPELTALHAKIGQLMLENDNDFLEGALTKAALLSARK